MQPLIVHTGLVALMDRSNIDTDAIIPKPFLKRVTRTGFGENLFDEWRYLDPYVDAQPGVQAPARRENPDFILNRQPWRQASILLARQNFGCGSSREHALWALTEFGIRVVIAESFGDIFYSNAMKNGLLPVVLLPADVARLAERTRQSDQVSLSVDLERQLVIDGQWTAAFDILPAHRQMLMSGQDEIGQTLALAPDIRAYEARRLTQEPWV